MILPDGSLRIVVATRPVDFRRGHDALAATASGELGLDIYSGVIVIFRSKRGDRLKALAWDGSGLVLTYKRLEQGRFAWPRIEDGVMRLSKAQFEALVRGPRLAAGAGSYGCAASGGRMILGARAQRLRDCRSGRYSLWPAGRESI